MERFQLGDFLKKVRKSQHLSTRALSERTKESESGIAVTVSQISKIENGKVHPTFQTLQKIAAALDLSLVIILDGSKAKPDSVAVVSTPEVIQSLPQAFNRQELMQLLLICRELTDEQIATVLQVAQTFSRSVRPAHETESIQE